MATEWKHFEEFKLTQIMCVTALTDTPEEEKKTSEFGEWILKIGDELIENEEDEAWVNIPKDVLRQKRSKPIWK